MASSRSPIPAPHLNQVVAKGGVGGVHSTRERVDGYLETGPRSAQGPSNRQSFSLSLGILRARSLDSGGTVLRAKSAARGSQECDRRDAYPLGPEGWPRTWAGPMFRGAMLNDCRLLASVCTSPERKRDDRSKIATRCAQRVAVRLRVRDTDGGKQAVGHIMANCDAWKEKVPAIPASVAPVQSDIVPVCRPVVFRLSHWLRLTRACLTSRPAGPGPQSVCQSQSPHPFARRATIARALPQRPPEATRPEVTGKAGMANAPRARATAATLPARSPQRSSQTQAPLGPLSVSNSVLFLALVLFGARAPHRPPMHTPLGRFYPPFHFLPPYCPGGPFCVLGTVANASVLRGIHRVLFFILTRRLLFPRSLQLAVRVPRIT